MQTIFVQMAVGLLPVTLFFIISAAVAKKHRTRNIFSAVFFVAAIGFLMFRQTNSEMLKNSIPEQRDRLRLIYAVAKEGSVPLARDFLQDERRNYQPEYALAEARFAAYDKDYSLATALYRKAVQSFPEAEEELSLVNEVCEAESKYYGITKDSDLTSIYKTRAERCSSTEKTVEKAMKSSVSDSEDTSFKKLADYIVFAEKAHHAFLYGEDFDLSETKKMRKRLENYLKENPGFEKMTQVRLARLKLQLLCGDYKAIAASVNEDSDYNELLVVSELFLNRYIKQGNFSGDFSKKNTQKYQVVYDKLNQIYTQSYTDKNREERNKAKSQLNGLKSVIKNPALGQMQEGLLEYAAEDYAMDASKAYLQVAKIEHSLGNESKSAEYIDRAMETVGNCEDYSYTEPMHKLLAIITTKEDTLTLGDEDLEDGQAATTDITEHLKGVGRYADEVVENNMTIKMGNRLEAAEESREGEEEEALRGDFSSRLQTYVNKKRTSVNIVKVDTSDFDSQGTVKATVNIGNHLYTDVEQLKKAMKVTDCGIEITDFKLENVDYTGANILLCVDRSGSMGDGKLEELKEAIRLFVAEKADIENIALVSFDSEIIDKYPFGTSTEELTEAANQMTPLGGTAVYPSLVYSIDLFTANPGEINSIILMTDGQDGSAADLAELKEYVGKPCESKGITVYPIGFGADVDGGYLNTIASVTGGKYLYASDPSADSQMNQLNEFFNSLRAQILNQYTVTFKAKDTLLYDRELRIDVGGLDADRAVYYLGSDSDSLAEASNEGSSPIYMQNRAVHGFVPGLLHKNGKPIQTVLKGEGFQAGDSISVKLKGVSTGVEWNTVTSYVDANSVSLTIPAEAVNDIYDAYISLNGKSTVLAKGISIFKQGSEQITDFGEYRFISYIKKETPERTVLSGYVKMNGWLNFNDRVELRGNFKEESIVLKSTGGSYINYSKEYSEGLAKTLSNIGVPVKISDFNELILYSRPPKDHSSDLEVDEVIVGGVWIGKYFILPLTVSKLYPNRIEFKAEGLIASLPFAGKILNEAGHISLEGVLEGSFSSRNIGIRCDIEYSEGKDSENSDKQKKPSTLGKIPILCLLNELELHIDTIKNEFEFGVMVNLKVIPNLDKMGLSMKWKGSDEEAQLEGKNKGLTLSEVKLYADGDVNAVVAGIPMTFSKFKIGIEDIDTSQNPLYWNMVGGCDISVAKIKTISRLAGLEKWLGDISLIKLEDTTLSLCLGDWYIGMDTELKLFEELDFGKIKIEIGKFYYDSALLNMSNEPVFGLRGETEIGPDWHFLNNRLKLQIAAETDLLSKFLGIQGRGAIDVNIKLWIISASISKYGEIAIGVRILSDGSSAFLIKTNPKLPVPIVWPKNMAGKV